MKDIQKIERHFLFLLLLFLAFSVRGQIAAERWSADKAWKWYNENQWICGFNYIPANAINYTAMWDKTS